MYFEPKIDAHQLRSEAILWMVMGPFLLIFLFLFGFAVILFAPICLVYGTVSLLMFFRTLNTGYLIKGLMFLFLVLFFLLFFFSGFGMFTIIAGIISSVLLVWLLVLIGIRDHKWRNMELLELAAMPVNDLAEGYSMRPMPTGKLSYQWKDLIRFTAFIRRNLISVPYFDKDKVIFSLNRSRFKLITFSSDYINDSWVSFDREGNISVHISKQDYELFRDSYAFDQLCNSLGLVFADFFKWHQQGREAEIIKKLDYIRIS